MASLNKVQLIGNLGRDPETRFSGEGKPICAISLATTDTWKDRQTGEKKEATEWHRVVFFDRLAEIAGEYLQKGSSIYLEGALRTRKYTDKDGVERYVTEVRAQSMQMLGNTKRGASGDAAPAETVTGESMGNFDDDIPF